MKFRDTGGVESQEKERQRETDRIFQLLVYNSDGYSGQDWARFGPGQHFIQDSHCRQGPKFLDHFCCFFEAINRVLDWKQSGLEIVLNWMPVLQMNLPGAPQCWPPKLSLLLDFTVSYFLLSQVII